MNQDQIYTVYTEQRHEGQRIDVVLAELIEEVSRSYIQKLIAEGSVFFGRASARFQKGKAACRAAH